MAVTGHGSPATGGGRGSSDWKRQVNHGRMEGRATNGMDEKSLWRMRALFGGLAAWECTTDTDTYAIGGFSWTIGLRIGGEAAEW
jgi:hypothetical protein